MVSEWLDVDEVEEAFAKMRRAAGVRIYIFSILLIQEPTITKDAISFFVKKKVRDMIEVVERFKTQRSTAEILQKQNENSKQEVRNISSPFLKWFSVQVLVLTELKEQKVKTTFILSKVISEELT